MKKPFDTNPGSEEALQKGCLCPILDNGHGKGFIYGGEQVFWINGACPLHGTPDIKEWSNGSLEE